MASKSVEDYPLNADDVETIRNLILDGIKASATLNQLVNNVHSAAKHGWSAHHLVAAEMVPRLSDLDVAEAAEWVKCLGLLPVEKEG